MRAADMSGSLNGPNDDGYDRTNQSEGTYKYCVMEQLYSPIRPQDEVSRKRQVHNGKAMEMVDNNRCRGDLCDCWLVLDEAAQRRGGFLSA